MLKILSRKNNIYFYDYLTNKIYTNTSTNESIKSKRNSLFSTSQGAFQLLNIESEKREAPDESTRLLVIETTEKCNLRCKYCTYSGNYFYERKHNNRSISFSVIEKAVKIFLSHSQFSRDKGITFYGGEPLLEKKIILKTIEYVKNKLSNEIFFNISTNGTLLDIEFIKQIQGLCGSDFCFSVSIDGPANIHDRYRRTLSNKNTHGNIMKNLEQIQNVIGKKISDHFQFICIMHPPYDLEALEDFFDKELFSDCYLKVGGVNPYDTFLTSELNNNSHLSSFQKQYQILSEKYINKVINYEKTSLFSRALFEKGLWKIHNRLMDPPLSAKHSGACQLGDRVFCSSEGILYPCEKCSAPFFKIGDVNNGISFDRINEIQKEWFNLIKADCSQCIAARMCSLCYVHAVKGNTFNIDRMRMNCEKERKNLRHFLYMYVSIMEENKNSLNFLRNSK